MMSTDDHTILCFEDEAEQDLPAARGWWRAALRRAVKTVAQTAVALIPAGIGINELPWLAVAGSAALAGLLSILTSIAGLPEVA